MGGTVSRDTVRGIEATILKTGNMRALSPGEDLIKQGVPLNSLYYISVGEMTISTTTPEGKSIVLGQRSRGDIVGELSFLLSAVPTATVGVAPDYAQQVTVIELERTRVLQLVQKDPRLASQVFQGLSMALAHRISLSSDATQAALMYDSQHMPSESHSPEASAPVHFEHRTVPQKKWSGSHLGLIVHKTRRAAMAPMTTPTARDKERMECQIEEC